MTPPPAPSVETVAFVFRQLLNAMANGESFEVCATKRMGFKADDVVPLERAGGGYLLDLMQRLAKLERELESASRFTIYLQDTRHVYLEWAPQRDGRLKWAVRDGERVCLSKDLEWEYEPLPSSRDDEWLAQCRFDTKEEAKAAAVETIKREAADLAERLALRDAKQKES